MRVRTATRCKTLIEAMGLLTILKKIKLKEKELRLLILLRTMRRAARCVGVTRAARAC